ncbi:MAG: exo-alpha-sialidase [Bacteroidales bacterium]|nr:exo-alpha-sialidase [Bacteroidales bacterium]
MKVKGIIKCLLFASMLGVIISCTPEPYTILHADYNFWFESASTPRLLPGESLDVIFRAENNMDPGENDLKLRFNVMGGGGSVSPGQVYTDDSGLATASWQLGSETFHQMIRASVYNKSGQHLTDKYLKAYSFIDDRWLDITGDFDGSVAALVADTVNDVTFMLAKNKIYKQGNRYFLWEELTDDLLQVPMTLDIDGNGVIYVTTSVGNVIKSVDHGVSWISCTKPYSGPYNIYLHISSDNYLWIFKENSTPKLSKDGGNTWVNMDIEMSYSGLCNIFRLADGSILYHGVDSRILNRSYDDGATWTTNIMLHYFRTIYVNEKDEIFAFAQENGSFGIYKSTDLGASFFELHSVYPYSGATVETNIKQWGDLYYIVMPGFGILKSSDLEHFTNYWQENALHDLFIDHNSNLIAKGYNNNTVYYQHNTK